MKNYLHVATMPEEWRNLLKESSGWKFLQVALEAAWRKRDKKPELSRELLKNVKKLRAQYKGEVNKLREAVKPQKNKARDAILQELTITSYRVEKILNQRVPPAWLSMKKEKKVVAGSLKSESQSRTPEEEMLEKLRGKLKEYLDTREKFFETSAVDWQMYDCNCNKGSNSSCSSKSSGSNQRPLERQGSETEVLLSHSDGQVDTPSAAMRVEQIPNQSGFYPAENHRPHEDPRLDVMQIFSYRINFVCKTADLLPHDHHEHVERHVS